MDKIFLNKETFSNEIELFVHEKNVSYMDAIIHICEMKDIEIESAAKHINKVIKNKLEAEAQELNYLPRGNTLASFFAS